MGISTLSHFLSALPNRIYLTSKAWVVRATEHVGGDHCDTVRRAAAYRDTVMPFPCCSPPRHRLSRYRPLRRHLLRRRSLQCLPLRRCSMFPASASVVPFPPASLFSAPPCPSTHLSVPCALPVVLPSPATPTAATLPAGLPYVTTPPAADRDAVRLATARRAAARRAAARHATARRPRRPVLSRRCRERPSGRQAETPTTVTPRWPTGRVWWGVVVLYTVR